MLPIWELGPDWLLDVLVEKVLAQNIVIFPKGLIICIK